jgi:phage FluMu protein Com
VASTAPIPCTKCATVLAHTDGVGRVFVGEAAVAVGRLTMVCTRCGAVNFSRQHQRVRGATGIPLDTPKSLIQTNPLDSSRGPM